MIILRGEKTLKFDQKNLPPFMSKIVIVTCIHYFFLIYQNQIKNEN